MWESRRRRGVSVQTTRNERRGKESSGGRRGWEGQGCGLIKERVSDHACSVCRSGPGEGEGPPGRLEANSTQQDVTVTPEYPLLTELVTE